MNFCGGISLYNVSLFKPTSHKPNPIKINFFSCSSSSSFPLFPELSGEVWPSGHVSSWTSALVPRSRFVKGFQAYPSWFVMLCGVTATDLAGDLRSTSTVIFIQVISIKHEDNRGTSSQRDEAGQGHLVAKTRTESHLRGHGLKSVTSFWNNSCDDLLFNHHTIIVFCSLIPALICTYFLMLCYLLCKFAASFNAQFTNLDLKHIYLRLHSFTDRQTTKWPASLASRRVLCSYDLTHFFSPAV